MSLPLMVRPNSVIAVGRQEDRPDYNYGDGVTLQVYELANGLPVKVTIPSVTGSVVATVEIRREGRTILAEWQGPLDHLRLLLVGVNKIAAAEGGTAARGSQGTFVTPVDHKSRLTMSLADTD